MCGSQLYRQYDQLLSLIHISIFATPHVIERANKPSWEEIKEKTQQLRQLCAEAQIDIMLYPGAEAVSYTHL